MALHRIAVIPGDGIGQEVVPAACQVLQAAAEVHGGLRLEWTTFDWNCQYYLRHGRMMPEDGLRILQDFEAIFLGAVGDPARVPDHVSLWGLLIPIRREFEQAINVRPARLLAGLPCPLARRPAFDLVVVRENSEGEYSQIGGRIWRGTDEVAMQVAVFSRRGTERAMRYAFELARRRRRHVTSATKSNGIVHTMPFWDEVFRAVRADYPDVEAVSCHVDALAAAFVTRPESLDVVVASNLFGDILTDLSAALMGSIGVAPAANLNVEGRYPSMFEPVHGSAPDIAGRGIANPVGQIWTGAMMLEHLGYPELGERVVAAVEATLAAGVKTPDIGGTATTQEVAEAVCQRLRAAT